MRNLILFSVAVGLSACVTVAKYDSMEYNHWVELHTTVLDAVDRNACASPTVMRNNVVPALETHARTIQTYIRHRPLTSGYGETAGVIRKQIVEMGVSYSKGDPSTTYCNTKLKTLGESIEKMLTVEGERLE